MLDLPDLQEVGEDGPWRQHRLGQKEQPQTGLLSCTHSWTARVEDAPASDICAVQTPSRTELLHMQAAGEWEKQD